MAPTEGWAKRKNTDTKYIQKREKATKPTVQTGHIAQMKFSGSTIIPSTSYPSIPLSMPPTIA